MARRSALSLAPDLPTSTVSMIFRDPTSRRTGARPPRDGARSPGRSRALVAAAAATLLVAVAGPVAAQDAPVDPTAPSTSTTVPGPPPLTDEELGLDDEPPPLGPLPEIAEGLDDVALTSETYDVAAEERDAIDEARRAAVVLVADKEAELEVLSARDRELAAAVDAARTRAEHWEDEAERLDRQARAVAVDSYMRGSSEQLGPLLGLDPDEHDDLAAAEEMSDSFATRQVRELEEAQRLARRFRNQEALSTAAWEGVQDALAAAEAVRDEAAADAERLAAELVEAEARVEDERRLATVVDTEFPLVVLDAYFKAAQLMEFLAPECGIEWWALAGIGRVESRHGTYGGAEVRADGSLTRRIIGIPLTGAGGTARIGDSDGGLIDGDPTIDRAAGPMQFIPQTWVRWGRDGDGDGDREPQNIYDAAAGAAAYLCATGPMRDLAGLQRGYFAYNHSAQYVYDVVTGAIRYGEDVEIEGVAPPPAPPPPPPPPPPPDPATDPSATTAPVTPGVDGSTPTTTPVTPTPTTAPPTTAPPTTAPPPTEPFGG